MEITRVLIQPVISRAVDQRIMAFVTVTFDHVFVVHDLKVIKDKTNRIFVAMPSRKMQDSCPVCRGKNAYKAQHCNWCGRPLELHRAPLTPEGTEKIYTDVAHPVDQTFRLHLEGVVLKEYEIHIANEEKR